jgi:hypothetical protein
MQPRSSPHNTLSLRFNVHWTRVSSHTPRVPRTALPPGMYLCPGRPDISASLQNVIAGVRSAYSTSRRGGSDHPSGIVIGSCGRPRKLGGLEGCRWRGEHRRVRLSFSPTSRMLKGSWTGHLGGNDFPFLFSSRALLGNFNSDDSIMT